MFPAFAQLGEWKQEVALEDGNSAFVGYDPIDIERLELPSTFTVINNRPRGSLWKVSDTVTADSWRQVEDGTHLFEEPGRSLYPEPLTPMIRRTGGESCRAAMPTVFPQARKNDRPVKTILHTASKSMLFSDSDWCRCYIQHL